MKSEIPACCRAGSTKGYGVGRKNASTKNNFKKQVIPTSTYQNIDISKFLYFGISKSQPTDTSKYRYLNPSIYLNVDISIYNLNNGLHPKIRRFNLLAKSKGTSQLHFRDYRHNFHIFHIRPIVVKNP